MIIVWRRWYFFGIAGIGLVIWSTVETRHARSSGSEPIDVSLASLQAGDDVSQPFIRLGEHVALYNQAVAWGEENRDSVDWSIYPCVGLDHAYLSAWNALYERYPEPNDIPESEHPTLRGVNVFIKTKQWRTMSEMPDGSGVIDKTEGLVFPGGELDSREMEVVRSIQPDLDPDRVRLLEFGRSPRPLWLCLALGVAGVLLIVQAFRSFRGQRARQKAEPAGEQPEAAD